MSRNLDGAARVRNIIYSIPVHTFRVSQFDIPLPPRAAAELDEMINDAAKSEANFKELVEGSDASKLQIDALQKFKSDVTAETPYQRGVYSKETCDFVNAKFKDLLDHMDYMDKPFKQLEEQIVQEIAFAAEKLLFFHEEKLDQTLAEHPDWAEEFRRRIYNLEYYPPFDGTPLEELY